MKKPEVFVTSGFLSGSLDTCCFGSNDARWGEGVLIEIMSKLDKVKSSSKSRIIKAQDNKEQKLTHFPIHPDYLIPVMLLPARVTY